jgi:hypothetical protein
LIFLFITRQRRVINKKHIHFRELSRDVTLVYACFRADCQHFLVHLAEQEKER